MDSKNAIKCESYKLNKHGAKTMMQETITQNKMAYSVEEISAQTSLSKAFLRLEIKRGKLKAAKFGRCVLVSANNLKSYLNEGENKDEK